MLELTDWERDKYRRQIQIEGFGEEAQLRLKSSAALVTRLGGLGGPTAMYLAMAGIGVAGEIVESLLGVVYVARKGATKWGALGAFAGGIAGAVLGTMVVPVLGSVVFAFVGAFGGAVLLEYAHYRSLDRALRTGFFAFVGKLLAMIVKFALGLAVLGLFGLGLWMVNLTYYDTWYRTAPSIHKSVGVLLFLVMALRLLWRLVPWIALAPPSR